VSSSVGAQPLETPSSEGARRGSLKIYLGYASHTGKTWRLLHEARRRKARGQDVVVGWLREKDQPALADLLSGLEVIPARQGEMDLEAILKRAPQVCIIDQLAHTNPPGSRHAERWQDVEELLAAGISVVTAVNIQYLQGLQPSIRELLGQAPAETVPDELVRGADEVALVDASPESVLSRPTPPGQAPMTEKELLALRELALLYAAGAMEEDVQEYRQEHHIEEVWETQERILVCLTARSRAPLLIERAYEAATRWKGELWAVYVTPDPEWSNLTPQDAAGVRSFLDMARERGARVEIVEDPDPARGILSCARQHDITQIFLGHAAAYPFRGALSRTVAGRILHEAEGIDVHVVADEGAGPRPPSSASGSGPRLPLALAQLLSGAPRPETRGHQRIYLGYAPGVGKTFQMLLDGQYLRESGQDVVVGFCEPHGRQDVLELLRAHEVIPPLDREPPEMDLEAILRRRPQICLVDELARPGRAKKVEALLQAGIHVFTTLDVTEVESLKDCVERITGVPVRDTVPDWVLEEADEVVLVDTATRALLNRVRRGAVFPGTEVPEELRTLFTEGSLNALRELAMRLTADRVEDELDELEKPSGRARPAEGVMVCLHERPSAAYLVRRGRRLAERKDAPCYAVYVAPDEDWTGVDPADRAAIEAHLDLARSLHVETHVLYGSDVARTLVDFAIRHAVTEVFMGRSRKKGWREFFRRSVIEQVIRLGPWMDITVVAERPDSARLRQGN
jgi:two-component system sensor histidine kinase KdpD